MLDTIPVWFAVPAAVVCALAYFVVELRHAVPDAAPDELSPLDVLERTGTHPHG